MTSGIGSADEVGVFDNGQWAVGNDPATATIFGFGWINTKPMVGDWNGDGKEEVGVYNPSGKNFVIQDANGYKVIGLGWTGVIPVVGNWNGDRADEVGVYNTEGTWALWNTDTNSADIVGFGWVGTEPVVGDWDGDDVTEVGIYNRRGNNFLLQKGSGFDIIGLGWTGVTPVVGDWNGDGADEVGVYNNAGTWALWNTDTNSAEIVGFGWAGTEPIVGDWNGDGIFEVGIYNTAGNNFLIQTENGFDVIGLGWSRVTPVIGSWIDASTIYKPQDKDSPEQPPTQQTPTEQIPSPVQDSNLTVHFIDVGQGDSILLEYGGKTMLIDAGENNMGYTVSAFLRERKISSLDYVVATHPHADHIGGMLTTLNNYPVGQFIDSGYPHTSKTYENMLMAIDAQNILFHVAERGETINLAPGTEIRVLNPKKEQSEELNENSVVLKITHGDVSFLLMGDAGLEAEENIMAAGYDVDVDILKVGHHGSTSASGYEFISAVSPDISVIEVGAGNDYGHPHANILQRLQGASTVYRTDYDGTITITTDGSRYTVTTEKTGSSGTSTTSTSEDAVYISDLDLRNEFVIITNPGSSTVDLTGWKIKDEGNKHTYTFPYFQLESGATVTIYTSKGLDSKTKLYWGSGNPFWNNDGDTASLYDSNGNLVDSLVG
ncbi:lamin tail domain-containing protein [Methanomethylovorans hollandica]|nr:lamin tail domain-containing protein [Methanomethylovorans hollandica]